MEKQNDNMRERLLARLPQQENLAAFREETAALLAKHEKALTWEKMAPRACYVIALAILVVNWSWGQKFGGAPNHPIWLWAGYAYFLGAVGDLRYRIYHSRVETLKELKQVELQILEMQASIQRRAAE